MTKDHRYEYPLKPDRRCDVVMKGGITSGVVYPLAVCRLAERFRLQNIGGTSAGAIAAVVAAAAEYRRRQGSDAGFRSLEGMPDWLGEIPEGSSDSNLFNLFQSRRSTRALFAILIAAISNPRQTVAVEVLLSALWNWRRRSIIGAFPGLAILCVLVFALAPDGGWLSVLAVFAGILASIALALIGAVGLVGVGIYGSAPAALVENGFGICSGMREQGASGPEALTEWLHSRIQEASGEPILTFGHLWGTTEGPRLLDLATLTTCLTFGRPYRLPFKLEDAFGFKAGELLDLFPEDVVEHLKAYSAGEWQDSEGGEILALPSPDKLPVLLAARLSLSFPVLLSTVPLYHLNEDQSVTKCVFSDGGICSNFPIDFFDSPVPRWPTLGVNLAGPIGEDGIDVWMPSDNWMQVPPGTNEIKGLGGFAGSIQGAMQNWRDNQYVGQPAYRDRIVQVRFAPGEGGLNLNMPEQLITTLSDRGDRAGAYLVARFADGTDPDGTPSELDWNNHRRVRLRTALAALEGFAVGFGVGYTDDETVAQEPRRQIANKPMPGELAYSQIADAPPDPRRYAGFDPGQRDLAQVILGLVLPGAIGWALTRGRDLPPNESPSMEFNAPQPSPELRIVPRI